jgi:hypothetical protein
MGAVTNVESAKNIRTQFSVPDLIALVHELLDHVKVGDGVGGEILDVGPGGDVLAHAEVGGTLGGEGEQITDTLQIYFHVANLDLGGPGGGRIVLRFEPSDAAKEILAEARDDAALSASAVAHHAIRFSRACLAVRKEARVVALEDILEQVRAKSFVDIFLRSKVRVGGVEAPEAMVKHKVARVLAVGWRLEIC